MNKYIDAEKLKELIQPSYKYAKTRLRFSQTSEDYAKHDREAGAYESVLRMIGCLQQEQPEVDLEDVIENYILENFGERWDGCVPVGCFELDLMAKHFYKLGLNARKEE